MGGAPAAAATADHAADNPVAREARPGRRAGVSASIVAGHDFDVFVSLPAGAVVVFDPSVWEVHVFVEVRQLVLASPPGDFFRLPIRPAVAILPAAIALVKKPLIVALELVIQDNTTDSPALFPEPLFRALVGAVDLGVVRQFAGLPDACVEGLTWFAAAVIALVEVGLEEVAPAVRQGHSAVVGIEGCGPNQPSFFEMPQILSRVLRVVAHVVKVVLRDDPERTNRPEQPALGTVDLVGSLALANQFALRAAGQVQILREDVSPVVVPVPAPFAGATATAAIAVRQAATIASVVRSRVVPIPHGAS